MDSRLPFTLYRTFSGRNLVSDEEAKSIISGWTTRPEGPLVWIHSANRGQGSTLDDLAARLVVENEDVRVLRTQEEFTQRDTPDGVIRLPLPPGSSAVTSAFLGHWRPDFAIWAEGHLSPRWVERLSQAEVPLALVDGREGARILGSGRWIPGLRKAVLRRLCRVLVADDRSRRYFTQLGAPPWKTEVIGAMQEGASAPPCDMEEWDRLVGVLASRPIWLALHVPEEEESLIIEAHQLAQRRSHRLMLILVPRHPSRGAQLAEGLANEGWNVQLRSLGEDPGRDTQIFVADIPGERGLWYRLAPVCFLGQSLVPGGGLNPFEATALGSALLHGPNVRNFQGAYRNLDVAGAAQLVKSAAELGEMVDTLQAPHRAAAMAHAAWQLTSAGAEATDRVLEIILESLAERGLI
ncbi:MAG: 3-deoxy-D-manno-octulosonic acid transferase [Rhodobacteraceae bacterium]|nr:3-deoxy-D-manno-octulosonic acid transferase [Paracoccaceae bacterium]